LDGLEELQHQEGDNYGLLTNSAVREFLNYFAAGGHTSFCLITSRAPVLDLIDYTTYTHRDVDRLSLGEGLALLRKIGVQGSDEALGKVVQDWDGHALTLSLLGAYLVDRYEGKVEHISDIPAPNSNEPLYERVRRVLHRYDEHLTEAERAFLTIFSAFRLPVKKSAFAAVFQAKTGSNTLKKPIATLNNTTFSEMVGRLVNYRILRQPQEDGYTMHPLVRTHYLAQLAEAEQVPVQVLHRQIADYYQKLAGKIPVKPTLEDLTPLIETVHHLCQAGFYDEGCRVYYKQIDQEHRWVLANELGAFETGLLLLREFFPKGNLSKNPQVSSPQDQGRLLKDFGFFLMCLGCLEEAESFYKRALASYRDSEIWKKDTIVALQNLAGLNIHRGQLKVSTDYAREAASKAPELVKIGTVSLVDFIESLALQAWIAYLSGELQTAKNLFQKAQDLERDLGSKYVPKILYLYAIRGIRYADYLRRLGDVDYARRVTEANLRICERERWVNHISLCHRVLGDLDADTEQPDLARQHYKEAIKKARETSRRDILIPVLASRGRFLAQQGDVRAAHSDLNEAQNYANTSGYSIYEVDIRVGLAWAHLKDGNFSAARTEAEQAKCMSAEMGYHWGQVDAEQVLALLDLDKKVV
jgi:tetratricopeptide (TPR) repeat protein